MLERLVRRLRLRGLAVRRVWIELGLENGETRSREIDLAAPTQEAQVLLGLARLALEKSPPPAAVERLRAIATPSGVESAQLDLFLPPLPAPAELAMTVARIESLAGSGSVASPGVRDTHLPDAIAARAFRFSTAEPARRSAHELPPRACMAQRALRPPRAARVQTRAGSPAHVALDSGRTGGRVLQSAGPWRFFGEWWGDAPFARDYWDVQLDDGGVYRLYHDLAHGRWFVDGIYD